MEVDSERTPELEDWEECSIVLYSRHGMTTALITHRTCAYMQKACTKSRSLKIPTFVCGRLSSLLAEELMAVDGCGGMKNLFYLARVVTGR